MTITNLKQDLRKYIKEKAKYSIPLRLAKAGAVIGGIAGGAKAVEKAIDIYLKRKKKAKKKIPESVGKKALHAYRYTKKATKYYRGARKKGKKLAAEMDEAKKETIKGIIAHRKMLGKAFRRAALTAAAWTTGERIISTKAAVAKRKKQIRKLAALQLAKEKARKKS